MGSSGIELIGREVWIGWEACQGRLRRAQKAFASQFEATTPQCYTEGRFVDIEGKSVPVKALLSQDRHNDPKLLGGRDCGSSSSSVQGEVMLRHQKVQCTN
ncbi:UNVERIFIED_CONTAM: hypothetical protein FKN15_020579 [Acipenser sinensis]